MGCHAQSDFGSSAARYEPREESGVDTAGRSYGPSPLECLLVANADCDLRSGSLHNLSNSETLRIITRKGRHEIGLILSVTCCSGWVIDHRVLRALCGSVVIVRKL